MTSLQIFYLLVDPSIVLSKSKYGSQIEQQDTTTTIIDPGEE